MGFCTYAPLFLQGDGEGFCFVGLDDGVGEGLFLEVRFLDGDGVGAGREGGG